MSHITNILLYYNDIRQKQTKTELGRRYLTYRGT